MKNVGNEPIVYLSVTLTLEAEFGFVFYDVTPFEPLFPGKSINRKCRLNGPKSGFSGGNIYPLTINGTLENLAGFAYTKQVPIISPSVVSPTEEAF